MGTQTTALEAAATALAAGKCEQALGKLLVAWRALRHPRIADVIDLVSAELTAKLAPIKGKTVAARMQAWHAIEKQKDPAMLGQLLATPWPGTWQPALPMLEPLLTWPDDPRMGMAFAKIVDETPYDTWTSKSFYRPLFRKLDQIQDLRTLPLLRAQLAKDKPYYYARDMRPLEERSVAALEKAYPGGTPPALDKATEAALAKLEAPYAEQLADAQQKSAGEAEHLAAILADPDDLAARAVYADWLGERGDPRGEFITLQLTASPTDVQRARERKLIQEHGVAWAGPLANWFEADRLVFEHGFFAGGKLRSRYSFGRTFSVEKMMADPAWALVRTLETGDDELLLELIARPELPRLRAVRGVDREVAEQIAGGPRRALESIVWHQWSSDQGPTTASALSKCESLPALKELGFDANDRKRLPAWLKSAPVLERVERVVIPECDATKSYLEALATRSGKLREVEIGMESPRHRGAGWRIVVQRDAEPGPFTRMVARPRGGPHDVMQLVGVFAAMPKGTLRELDVATPKKIVLKEADKQQLAKAVAQLGKLERIAVPWQSVLAARPAPKRASIGPRLHVQLEGEPLLDAKKFDKVWKLVVDELGQVYDSFEVGYGSKWRPLGDDPYERAKKWAGNARLYRLELVRDGQPGKLILARGKRHAREYTVMELVLGERSHADFVDWFAKFVDIADFDDGYVGEAGQDIDRDAFDLGFLGAGPSGGWLVYFGAMFDGLLPAAKVKQLGSRPGLGGVFVRETKRGLLVGTAAIPADVTSKRLRALASALVEIVAKQMPSYLGYDFTARTLAVLSPVAKELGLAHAPDVSTPTSVVFAKGKQRLEVQLPYLLDADRDIRIELQYTIDRSSQYVEHLVHGTAKTAAQLDKLLATAAKQAPARAPKFFASSAEKPRK